MSKFKTRFFQILEQDEISPDAQAMATTLEPETDPTALGANVNSAASKAIYQREQQMLNQVKDWIARLQEFTTYLNGTESGSVQSILNSAESETLLDKIKTTETKKITRTATELAGLAETLKGYLATSSNPKYKYV